VTGNELRVPPAIVRLIEAAIANLKKAVVHPADEPELRPRTPRDRWSARARLHGLVTLARQYAGAPA
jgi:hypothetical protein